MAIRRRCKAPGSSFRPRSAVSKPIPIWPSAVREGSRIVITLEDVVSHVASCPQSAAELQYNIVAFVRGIFPSRPPALTWIVGPTLVDGGSLVGVAVRLSGIPVHGAVVSRCCDTIDLLGVENGC